MRFATFLNTLMVRRRVTGVVCGLAGAVTWLALPASARGQSARDSTLYVRAQEMVANGDAAGGRKLADSVAAVAAPGSTAFAEGLYWRATLAPNARDSEHEYRQIIVDYPLSPRVPDALLRIGQLESARGEGAAALQHFQRLVLEHPESPLRADASYWVAKMYFDANDAVRGCTANADALASVLPSNVELKNRIDFQQQRCRGVTIATNSAPTPALPASAAVTVPVKSDARAESSVAPAAPPAPARAPSEQKAPQRTSKPAESLAVPSTIAPIARGAATVTDARGGVVSRAPTKEEVDRALASAQQSSIARKARAASAATHAAKVSSRKPAVNVVPPAAPPAAPAAASHGLYAIQVAAFSARAPAEALGAKLRGRGYVTYVDGTSAPYRVRLGRYPTYAAATAALVKLKAKRMDGFVVQR